MQIEWQARTSSDSRKKNKARKGQKPFALAIRGYQGEVKLLHSHGAIVVYAIRATLRMRDNGS